MLIEVRMLYIIHMVKYNSDIHGEVLFVHIGEKIENTRKNSIKNLVIINVLSIFEQYGIF